MIQETVEEYLGAIYRLRTDTEDPLPLSQLAEYFGFSPVSVHEMIRKLDDEGWVAFHPYRGVTLTETGEASARALLRRHRLWERFLTDSLGIGWDEAHTIAGDLEHAAPELVTERLALFLGGSDMKTLGEPVYPAMRSPSEWCLRRLGVGAEARVSRIALEKPVLRQWCAEQKLAPGRLIRIMFQDDTETRVAIHGLEWRVLAIPAADAQDIWVELV